MEHSDDVMPEIRRYADEATVELAFEESFLKARDVENRECNLDWNLARLKIGESIKLRFPRRLWSLNCLVKLRISDCVLESLPSEIGNLTELACLSLEDCAFTELPASLGSLRKLKKLNITRCKIRALPLETARLENLQELSLLGNEYLQSLPPDLGKLATLQRVKFLEHRLPTIPNEIFSVVSLRQLILQGCGIEKLPSSIVQLTNLEVLSISGCAKLLCLPDEIGLLTNLKTLAIFDSGVSELPASIGKLANLEEFYMDELPNVSTLPDEIGNLSNLRILHVRFCPITNLPVSLGNLSRLEELNLSLPTIHTFPSMRELKQLNKLCIDFCNHLEALPKGFEQLPELQHLCISAFNREFTIPRFPCLKTLLLPYCHRDSVLQVLQMPAFKESSLETVDISGTLEPGDDIGKILAFLPDTVQSLTMNFCNIQSLTGFEHLPQSIRKLDLDWNCYFEIYKEFFSDTDQSSLSTLLDKYQQLCFICGNRWRETPIRIRYLLCFNACGRVLCRQDSNSVALSVWPAVLARVQNVARNIQPYENNQRDSQEVEASVVYSLLHGPAFLSRTEPL